MKLSNNLHEKIAFAVFVADHKVKPYDLAKLIHYAHRAFNAGERATGSEKAASAEKHWGNKVEEQAKEMGFGVEWNGLWPTLMKGTRTITLPV